MEFFLTPNQSIILNNGTELFEKMYLVRKTVYEPQLHQYPRGIILKIRNESLWEGAKRCFASYFQTNSSANQKWFSEAHKHDIGAISNNENILVNLNKSVADDRGLLYLEIDPS